MNDHPDYFSTRPVEDSAECRSGDVHPQGGLFVIQPFVIGKTQGLQLVKMEIYLFQINERDASRLEISRPGLAGDTSAFFGSRHSCIIIIRS